MKYIIKQYDDCYFTGTFEVQGTIIMVNFSNVKEDAKIFNDYDEAIKTLNRIKCQNANVIEI